MLQRSFGVATNRLFNQVCVHSERIYADKLLKKLWFVRSFSSQHHCKNLYQLCTKECKTGCFLFKVKLRFLCASRLSDCDTIFAVNIVSPLYEHVHGFKILCDGKVKTESQMVKFWQLWMFFSIKKQICFCCNVFVHWCVRGVGNCNLPLPLQFYWLWHFFTIKKSVLFENSCLDALETNTFVRDFVPKWLWSAQYDKIYYK